MRGWQGREILRYIEVGCVLVLTIFVCWFIYEAHALVVDARESVRSAGAGLRNVSDAALQVSEMAGKLNIAADAETEKLQASVEELRKTERATRAAIDSLRQIFIDVHQQSLPKLNLALDDLDKGELQVASDFSEQMKHVTPVLDQLAADVGDPQIKAAIANLAASSADLDRDLAQLQPMLVSTTATAQDVQRVADKVAAEYTKTRNLAYALFKELLGLGAQGVQFFLKK